jgi:transposase
MTGTMTWVGLDVHARSTHAAAIDTMTGELTRKRFGAGVTEPVAWLEGLAGPVRACYEAGPTGFGLYRAAVGVGVAIEVIAPSKTPRAAGERVKTDRRDAELLARLLLAGSLKRVIVPAPEVEAARELTRAHDASRRDLMTARHRVSKMLLRHGFIYPKDNTWDTEHRKWLARQQFSEPTSELVFGDLVAHVDGLTARKAELAERISRLATDPLWWPNVARLRAFRGIDTLTALSIHLELGADWQRFERPAALGCPAAPCDVWDGSPVGSATRPRSAAWASPPTSDSGSRPRRSPWAWRAPGRSARHCATTACRRAIAPQAWPRTTRWPATARRRASRSTVA